MNHQVGFSAFGGDSRVTRKRDGATSLETGPGKCSQTPDSSFD